MACGCETPSPSKHRARAQEGWENKWPQPGNLLEPNSSDPTGRLISRAKQRRRSYLVFYRCRLAKCLELFCQKCWGYNRIPGPLNAHAACSFSGKAGYLKKGLVECGHFAEQRERPLCRGRMPSCVWNERIMETMAGCAFPSQRACSLFTLACWCQVPRRGKRRPACCFMEATQMSLSKYSGIYIYIFNVSAFVIYPSDSC